MAKLIPCRRRLAAFVPWSDRQGQQDFLLHQRSEIQFMQRLDRIAGLIHQSADLIVIRPRRTRLDQHYPIADV